MAGSNGRTAEQVQREIEREREQLAGTVEQLRTGIHETVGVSARLRANLPVMAAGAMGTAFVAAGGIGASMRLLARRSREGRRLASFGRFTIVERD